MEQYLPYNMQALLFLFSLVTALKQSAVHKTPLNFTIPAATPRV